MFGALMGKVLEILHTIEHKGEILELGLGDLLKDAGFLMFADN